MLKKQHLVVLFALLASACASIPNQTERAEGAANLAIQHGWVQLAIHTNQFVLQAFLPSLPSKADTLSIYLEGDGLAWVKPTIPSTNPTPINPLALKLALLDTNPTAYLARPCQYIAADQSKNCIQKYWTSHRFAPEVIASANQAINQIKRKFGATKLILVGYSGGGAVAALAAAKRNDVIKLVTVAANLDHMRWTQQNNISPLSGSLNAADAWLALQKIPQQHYVGGRDDIINENIVRSYTSRFRITNNIKIEVLPTFDHHCCWESIWPSIVESYLPTK
jgi:alpha/beta hydrolase fold